MALSSAQGPRRCVRRFVVDAQRKQTCRVLTERGPRPRERVNEDNLSAYWSIRSNLKSLGREETRPMIESAVVLLDQVEAAEIRVRQVLDERIG